MILKFKNIFQKLEKDKKSNFLNLFNQKNYKDIENFFQFYLPKIQIL